MNEGGRQLPRFAAYLEATGTNTITLESAMAWAQQPTLQPSSSVWASRMTAARGFARYLAGIDARTQVSPAGLLPYRKHRRVPFLYSLEDVALLMSQARQTIASPLRAATFETLIGMLAVTGMRIGEAIRLDRTDVDWDQRLAVVRLSKFGNQEHYHCMTVPCRCWPTTRTSAIGCSHRQRRRASSSRLPESGPGTATSSTRFRRLFVKAGIGATSSSHPRIHDLRHSFAVRTMVAWYRNGENTQSRLAWLSTYQREASPRTVSAYRDTFRLLLGFVQLLTVKTPYTPGLEHLDASVIAAFLGGSSSKGQLAVVVRSCRAPIPRRSPAALDQCFIRRYLLWPGQPSAVVPSVATPRRTRWLL
ncbi:MAG: tyrosine-type recombinase/integrase [Chloroflexi bacterium]|nr:tyrosine-type recombinase/integrase [Chloroflexota bacterium]